MRDLIILLVHAVATLMRVARPGGVRAVVAESILAKHQLLIHSRSRRPRSESPYPGSNRRGLVFTVDSAVEASSGGDRVQDVEVLEFSSSDGAMQISVTVLSEPRKRKPGPKRPTSSSPDLWRRLIRA